MPSHEQARALLQAELHEQTQRLHQLHTQWNQGRPIATTQQPHGSPAYLERVAALREQLQRTEADLAALRRELARLP
jgi:DNA repair exonuclease SbcCD ATPase subunit